MIDMSAALGRGKQSADLGEAYQNDKEVIDVTYEFKDRIKMFH